MALLAWIVALPALGANCPTPRTSADLVARIDDAKAAYGALQVAAFREAMAEVRATVPCLTDEVTSHVAAELHRYEGLLSFLDRSPERSMAAFAAARRIEPNYRFPESLVPVGNPVLADYTALDPDSSPRLPISEPIDGRLLVDGEPIAERARDFPVVVQVLSADGSVRDSAYVWSGDPLPAYLPKPLVARTPIETVGDGTAPSALGAVRSGPHVGLLGTAGGAAAVSGALYLGAFFVHKKYYDEDTELHALGGLRSLNNGLLVGSGATLGVALGLGTSAFLVGQF